MTAKELAKSIADGVIDAMRKHGHFMERKTVIDVESSIATKLDPLVSDAERYHKLMEINDHMNRAMGYDN